MIVPVRDGSKRIPRKNIVEIRGQSPLTILKLKFVRMNSFEEIVVSTDGDDEISRSVKASVVKRISPKLLDSITISEEVVRDFTAVRDF